MNPLEIVETPIAYAALLSDDDSPNLLAELVEVPGNGSVGYYRIRVYRADRGPHEKPLESHPFITFYGDNLAKLHKRLRLKWRECTGGQELPKDAFGGGV